MKLLNERETLLKVAEYLEQGTPDDFENIGRITFNLAIPGDVKDCGSVACIGGCAWIYENPNASMREASNYVNETFDSRLANLYYPNSGVGFSQFNSGKKYEDITPKQAAIAIRRYLNDEHRFWDHVK